LNNGSTYTALYTNTAGLYYVTVSTAYCSTTDSINLAVVQCNLAVANFTASQTNICENSCINFSDLSANAESWHWNFPGANTNTSTMQNPTNICYSSPGTYEVELIVTNQFGSNAISYSNYITVNANPSVPFVIVNGFWLSSSVGAAGYQWYLNGNAIQGATQQSYSATNDGFYYVLIDNGSGCTTSSEEVYVNITAISNVDPGSALQIYPNPANEKITISGFDSGIKQLELVDLAGKTVFFQEITSPQKNFVVNTMNLENGIYFLKINSANKTDGKKIVINH
jgi:PKD repeat protein